jgi:hypothetical protein
MPAYSYEPCVIANGATTSGEVDLRGKRLHAVKTPSALTGNTLSFTASEKPSGTFVGVNHLNTLAVTATTLTGVAANQHIVAGGSGILPDGIQNCILKLVSGSTEGTDRTFILTTSVL